MSSNVFEGICDSFNAIFDHRPVLQLETNHFLKEFEEKRVLTGGLKLQNALKSIEELGDVLQDIKDLAHIKLGNLNASVISTTKMAEAVIINEGIVEESFKENLLKQESEMNCDCIRFEECLLKRAEELDNQMNKELDSCRKKYSSIENGMKSVL